jgi:hypothetical protein
MLLKKGQHNKGKERTAQDTYRGINDSLWLIEQLARPYTSVDRFWGAVPDIPHVNVSFEITIGVCGRCTPRYIHLHTGTVSLRPHPRDISIIIRITGATPRRRDGARPRRQRARRGCVRRVVVVVVVVPPRLAGMGHVAITIVDCVARARVGIGRGATALDDDASFALSFPLARPLSPLSFPLLVALSVTELSLVLAFGRYIVPDV